VSQWDVSPDEIWGVLANTSQSAQEIVHVLGDDTGESLAEVAVKAVDYGQSPFLGGVLTEFFDDHFPPVQAAVERIAGSINATARATNCVVVGDEMMADEIASLMVSADMVDDFSFFLG
jgi:hypothetical protein